MPTHLMAHLQFAPANAKAKIAKEPPSQCSTRNDNETDDRKEGRRHNNVYKK